MVWEAAVSRAGGNVSPAVVEHPRNEPPAEPRAASRRGFLGICFRTVYLDDARSVALPPAWTRRRLRAFYVPSICHLAPFSCPTDRAGVPPRLRLHERFAVAALPSAPATCAPPMPLWGQAKRVGRPSLGMWKGPPRESVARQGLKSSAMCS